MGKTLLIISLGQLGANLLEAVSRSDLFDRIVVASRSKNKSIERANNAIVGAGLEGFFPVIEAVELNAEDPAFVRKVREIDPNIIFTAPTLLPWWKVSDPAAVDLPFGVFTALHLSPMIKIRDRLAEADITAKWIGASYPDVINASLVSSGFGPDCGIGNVQEPISKIQLLVGRGRNVPPQDVNISLVAQHAFEYYAMRAEGATDFPPYMMQAFLYGEDVTAEAETALRARFPFPYDLFFNRVTASAGLMALRALVSETPKRIHLPGCLGLPGGYPAMVNRNGIALDLPDPWTQQQAIDVNKKSMATEGIASIESDGTILFTEKAQQALFGLTGKAYDSVNMQTVHEQAETLLASISGNASKLKVTAP